MGWGKGDWEYTPLGGHWAIYGIIESLYCTSESNITLNCTGIKVNIITKNNAVRNIHIKLCDKWLYFFFGYVPQNRIGGSYGKIMFKF